MRYKNVTLIGKNSFDVNLQGTYHNVYHAIFSLNDCWEEGVSSMLNVEEWDWFPFEELGCFNMQNLKLLLRDKEYWGLKQPHFLVCKIEIVKERLGLK